MTVRSLKTSNRPFTICIFGSTPEFFELNYKVAGSMSTTSSTIFIIDDDKVDVYGTCLRHWYVMCVQKEQVHGKLSNISNNNI